MAAPAASIRKAWEPVRARIVFAGMDILTARAVDIYGAPTTQAVSCCRTTRTGCLFRL